MAGVAGRSGTPSAAAGLQSGVTTLQGAVHGDTCRAACDLIDRKLTGEHRKEARKWVRRCRYDTQIRALMGRLESLPDIGDAS